MTPTQLARNVSTVAVASIAAWSSWSHMVHVALKFGERPEVAYVLPISVDGMLIVASAAMVEDKRSGRPVRWSARIAFTAGVAASVAANIAAAEPTLGARIVAAWPALALLLVVEMLSRERTLPSPPATSPALDGGATGARDGDDVPVSGEATRVRPDRTTPSPKGPGADRTRSRTGGPAGRAAEAVMRLHTDRPDVSAADIAAEIGVSERHVRRLLKADHPHRTRSP